MVSYRTVLRLLRVPPSPGWTQQRSSLTATVHSAARKGRGGEKAGPPSRCRVSPPAWVVTRWTGAGGLHCHALGGLCHGSARCEGEARGQALRLPFLGCGLPPAAEVQRHKYRPRVGEAKGGPPGSTVGPAAPHLPHPCPASHDLRRRTRRRDVLTHPTALCSTIARRATAWHRHLAQPAQLREDGRAIRDAARAVHHLHCCVSVSDTPPPDSWASECVCASASLLILHLHPPLRARCSGACCCCTALVPFAAFPCPALCCTSR